MRILAVDIGGSAVKYGICDETGRLTQTGSFPLPASMAEFLGQLQSLPSL